MQNQESISEVDTQSESNDEASFDSLKDTKFTHNDALRALRAAVIKGEISSKEAGNIRRKLGFSNAFFTKKRPTDSERKATRKAQRAARKIQRKKK